jgi:hypothetical protein
VVTAQAPHDLYGHLQAQNARLHAICLALSLTVLALGGLITWYALHGLPVHYIPPGGPGLSQPGVIPEASAQVFASRWLAARYTFTPATVQAMHAAMLPTLHPTLGIAFKAQGAREAVLVKESQLSSQLVVLSGTVSRTGGAVTVDLDARRTIWIGGLQVREEPVHAVLTVAPWVVHGEPEGLVVSRVVITPALSVAGQ